MVLIQKSYICDKCDKLDGYDECCKLTIYVAEEDCSEFKKPKRCPYKNGFVKAKWTRVE